MKIFRNIIILLILFYSLAFSQIVKKDSLQKNVNSLQELRDLIDD